MALPVRLLAQKVNYAELAVSSPPQLTIKLIPYQPCMAALITPQERWGIS